MCNRDLSRVNGGLSRVASLSLRERGVSDGAYVGLFQQDVFSPNCFNLSLVRGHVVNMKENKL